MAFLYSDTAQKLIELVGGPANIRKISNCMTRLRLVLNDSSLADDEAVRSLEHVKGIYRRDPEYHIIIGTEVFRLSEEFSKLDSSGWITEPHEIYGETSLTNQQSGISKAESASGFTRPSLDRIHLHSPMTGQLLTIGESSDETMASGILGKGVLILPSEGRIVAPDSGIISAAMESAHAIGMYTDNGVKLLIHVGYDRSYQYGSLFTMHVKTGSHVEKGDLLIEFDFEKLRRQGFNTETCMIITNSEDYVVIKPVQTKTIHMGDKLMTLI